MKEPPKRSVLLFCSSLNIGGSERNVVNIAKQIDKSKFDVHVLCMFGGGPLESELVKAGVPYSFGYFGRIFDFRVYLRIIKELRRKKYDIIHCFNYPTIYFGVLLGFPCGIPKIIVAIQALDTWKSKMGRLLDKMIRPFVSLYIADSEGARQFAIAEQGLSPARTVTIYDGVDVISLKPMRNAVELRRELGIANGTRVVGVVARLQNVHKGQSFFINAIPEILGTYPDTNFLIVGDGEDRAYLESMVRDNGLTNKVIFTGFRMDVADILSIIDILVIPSIQWESITKTMLEAMALRRPIVATDVGDIREILRDQETGILVPPRNSGAIAKAVNELLADHNRATNIGIQGFNEIHELGLILGKSVRRLEDLYLSTASLSRKYLRLIYFLPLIGPISLMFFCQQFAAGIYRMVRPRSKAEMP